MLKKVMLGSVAVLLAISLVACQPAVEPVVDTQSVETENIIPSLEVFGVVKGEVVPISFDVELKVLGKIAKTGDLVRQGDGLFKFDRNKIDELAELKKLEQYAASKKLDGGQIEGSKLRNSLATMEKTLGEKKQNYLSQQKLYTNGMISKSELDAFQTEIRSLETDVANMRLNLSNQGASDSADKASDQVVFRKAEIQYSEYEDLLQSQELISGDYVVSPYKEAIVSGFDVSDNANVDPKVVILNLISTDSLYIEAEVSEEFIKQVKVGNAVEIKPLFDKEKLYHGKVVSISHLPFEKNGEMIVPIRIELEDRDGELLVNFNVDVKIFTE